MTPRKANYMTKINCDAGSDCDWNKDMVCDAEDIECEIEIDYIRDMKEAYVKCRKFYDFKEKEDK